jgi:hypothetical protein
MPPSINKRFAKLTCFDGNVKNKIKNKRKNVESFEWSKKPYGSGVLWRDLGSTRGVQYSSGFAGNSARSLCAASVGISPKCPSTLAGISRAFNWKPTYPYCSFFRLFGAERECGHGLDLIEIESQFGTFVLFTRADFCGVIEHNASHLCTAGA